MISLVIIEGSLATLMPNGPDLEQKVLGPDFQISCFGRLETIPEEVLANADALIVRTTANFGKERIGILKKCRVIVSIGVGYEHIDGLAAKERNIPVCNVPDYGIEEVADTALAMILYLHRRIGRFYRQACYHAMDWDWRIFKPISRTSETNLGIIGLGRIGSSVALKAKALGYHVFFYDPYLSRGIEKSLGLTRVFNQKELLSLSDVVTIHTPLTQETLAMINEDFLSQMKPNGILINVSRGGILKSLDVITQALQRWKNFAVGLDVLPEEPPPSHPLLEAWKNNEEWVCDRFLLTPHASFYSEEACQDLRNKTVEIVKQVCLGKKPYNQVN